MEPKTDPKKMPKVKTNRTKKAPKGFSDIEPILDEFHDKLKEIENDKSEDKRIKEALWPIFRIHHQRSRFIFDSFYKKKTISRELYEWLLEEKYADRNLIAKWKKHGYERLCCLRCIQKKDTNFGGTCICRVPGMSKNDDGQPIECDRCGCHGCSSGGKSKKVEEEENEEDQTTKIVDEKPSQ